MKEFDKLILIQRISQPLSFAAYGFVYADREYKLIYGFVLLVGLGFYVYFYKNPNKASEEMYAKDKKYWNNVLIWNLVFLVIWMGIPIFGTGFNIIVLAVFVPLVLIANGLLWYQTNVVFSRAKEVQELT